MWAYPKDEIVEDINFGREIDVYLARGFFDYRYINWRGDGTVTGKTREDSWGRFVTNEVPHFSTNIDAARSLKEVLGEPEDMESRPVPGGWIFSLTALGRIYSSLASTEAGAIALTAAIYLRDLDEKTSRHYSTTRELPIKRTQLFGWTGKGERHYYPVGTTDPGSEPYVPG